MGGFSRGSGRCGGAVSAPASGTKSCQKVILNGETKAGQEWRQAIGQGWIFRLFPIQAGNEGFTGWDLVVDREEGAGFPDALLLATPPYRSVGEHEVGTTFGLRAQDAVSWNPRSFRFLGTVYALRQGQLLYERLEKAAGRPDAGWEREQVTKGLMDLEKQALTGEFHIVEARLAPGVADAPPFAEAWAHATARAAYTVEPSSSGKPSARGELHWIRFSATLWLPEKWKTPGPLHAVPAECPH